MATKREAKRQRKRFMRHVPSSLQGQAVLTRWVRPRGALVRSGLAWSKLRPASSIGADFADLLADSFDAVTSSRRAGQLLAVDVLCLKA